jgi:hypothetical protein
MFCTAAIADVVAHAEPEDGDGDPGDGRDRPQDLDGRVEGPQRRSEPAEEEAERNADDHRQQETAGDAEQRGHHVVEQHALARQLDRAGDHLERRRENVAAGPLDGKMPNRHEHNADQQRQDDGFDTSSHDPLLGKPRRRS